MDVVTTSLEALIQRATNPQNQKPDIAAIEAFCVMITKEAEGAQIGSKLLASHIQSSIESEALQALTLLDTCMRRCGPPFHAEVGKFRFLNEMIRLVSPKYLGNKTPSAVRQKVLQLLYIWTVQYPRESKIKEAYEMLKKQGVVQEDSAPVIDTADDIYKVPKAKCAIFEDEEKSKLLQKLLQSKNPDDLQAANRLIKVMVKEDERRAQQNSRKTMELESVHNNVKLLSDMVDCYKQNETSTEDLALMRELYDACERMRPAVLRLATETHDNEELLRNVLAVNDELSQIIDKYTSTVFLRPLTDNSKSNNVNNGPSLLDLSSPLDTETLNIDSNVNTNAAPSTDNTNPQTDLEVLGDIFSSLGKTAEPATTSNDSLLLTDTTTIMQPLNVYQVNKKADTSNNPIKIDNKAKALEELNELGETLLKQSLSGTTIRSCSKDTNIKTPMNSLVKKFESASQNIETTLLGHVHSNSLQTNTATISSLQSQENVNNNTSISSTKLNSDDDSLIDISMQSSHEELHNENDKTKLIESHKSASGINTSTMPTNHEQEMKLTDITVNLEEIKPSTNPPLTVIEEKNSISVILHFTKDSPRPDVSVVVITTMSKNTKPLHNYLFQAVVPKKCKCRLLPPSGTDLPAHNPFLPPSAITQIMLIANPHKEPVSLKFMLSYTMDDETLTEMGEVDKLPYL